MQNQVAPETVALLRRRYADGATLTVLKAESGIDSLWSIYRCLDGYHDDGSGQPLAALPRRREDKRLNRAGLVKRLWRSAEQQVEQIEKRMQDAGRPADEGERDARTLAVLVRTLRELAAFDERKEAAARRKADANNSSATNDDAIPRNIDDLRRELARKIEALVQAECGPAEFCDR